MTHDMRNWVQYFFDQLYTNFAWAYDIVAMAASLGEWQRWGQAALAFLPHEGRVLEIAHGPGHLQVAMHQEGYQAIGIDLSPQMGRLARQRTYRYGVRLARASALHLPFADGAFAGAVSTFPSSFIFAPQTLTEAYRVLRPGGVFVVVPMARLTGQGLLPSALRLAYRLTGQREDVDALGRRCFEAAGFRFAQHTVITPRAEVMVWVGAKPAG
jgi:ubiquinone/menaquinone biosynthesis C-methylase UbiE